MANEVFKVKDREGYLLRFTLTKTLRKGPPRSFTLIPFGESEVCRVNWITYYLSVCDLLDVRLPLGFFFRTSDRNKDHRTKSHVSVFLKRGGNMQLHVSIIFTSCRNVKTQVLRDSVKFPERKLSSHVSAMFKLADFRYCAFPSCFCKWIYSFLLHLPKHKPSRWFLEQ